jgi:hypothetical protein
MLCLMGRKGPSFGCLNLLGLRQSIINGYTTENACESSSHCIVSVDLHHYNHGEQLQYPSHTIH